MRVAIVAGLVVAHDAISSAVVGQATALQSIPGIDHVSVFAQHIDPDLEVSGNVVSDSWQLATHPLFRSADVVIYHWGIHFDLFDTITLVRPPQRAIVHFHNCTPRHLVPQDLLELIDRSIAQISHAVTLPIVFWTYSEFNFETLRSWGVDKQRIAFVPFAIAMPDASRIPIRHCEQGVVEFITVGRRVEAKGLHVLLNAVALLGDDDKQRMRLRIVGSSRFSDERYEARLRQLVEAYRLETLVEFIDEPSTAALFDLYLTSDVVISASFHEGLCVPIVEGYSAGCRAIGTNVGNLRFVVQEPDLRVPPGDAAALAAAMHRVWLELEGGPDRRSLYPKLTERYSSSAATTALQLELYRIAASNAET